MRALEVQGRHGPAPDHSEGFGNRVPRRQAGAAAGRATSLSIFCKTNRVSIFLIDAINPVATALIARVGRRRG